jgi:hypothetical protein
VRPIIRGKCPACKANNFADNGVYRLCVQPVPDGEQDCFGYTRAEAIKAGYQDEDEPHICGMQWDPREVEG